MSGLEKWWADREFPKALVAAANELTTYLEENLREEAGWKRLRSGTQIVKSISKPGAEIVNVIPPIGVPGRCRRILFVAIGAADSPEKRILEAYEHVSAKCPMQTLGVIFYAVRWDALAWIRHEPSFRRLGVSVVVKFPLMAPQILL